MDNLPDPTFIIDTEKRVLAWNAALAELTGVTSEDILGKGQGAYAVPFHGEAVPVLVDHFGDVDSGLWRQHYDLVETRGDTLYAEGFVPFLHGGQGAHLAVTASPFRRRDGQIIGAIQTMRDLTDRHDHEESLRASEEKLRSLIGTMNDGLVIFDAEGRVTFANRSLCRLLGWAETDLEGFPVTRLLTGWTEDQSLESWFGWTVGADKGLENEWQDSSGTTVPLHLSPSHICDARGRFAGGLVLVTDLSRVREDARRIRDLNEMLEQRVIDGTHELLATNQALRRSEERFRRIIESLQQGYIFYSRTTDGEFTYVSPSFRKILGLSDLADFSSGFATWLQRRDNREARASSEKINLGYRQDPGDFHIPGRDGALMTMEIQETPVFRKNGTISSVEGLLRDVTEDRHNQTLMAQTQQQLIQSEKQAALGSMVAGLSHEINTPLGIGVTAASHLVEEIKQCLQAYSARQLTQGQFENYLSEAGESAQLIQANLNRATDLLQNFKQVATDQTVAKERSFMLDEYLTDVVQSLKPRFRNTGFRISCRCPENLVLHCDPGALYQVLSNLVMNSLTHGFEGLLVGEISIRAHRRGPFLELDYRDNGNGMKPQELRRLYEPFFTTKRGRGGTGLGMHIVYSNVTKTLGGNIKSTSKPGRGTRITITLPLTGDAGHV